VCSSDLVAAAPRELLGVRYEELLPRPLDEVRAALQFPAAPALRAGLPHRVKRLPSNCCIEPAWASNRGRFPGMELCGDSIL
jgi:hypothetical protein